MPQTHLTAWLGYGSMILPTGVACMCCDMCSTANSHSQPCSHSHSLPQPQPHTTHYTPHTTHCTHCTCTCTTVLHQQHATLSTASYQLPATSYQHPPPGPGPGIRDPAASRPSASWIPFEQKEPDYLLWGPLRSSFASSCTPAGCLLQPKHGLDEGARGAKSGWKKKLLALNGFFDNPPSVLAAVRLPTLFVVSSMLRRSTMRDQDGFN
jgi:hypothetical protein